MKKLLFINMLFCFLVIIVSSYYFDSKSKKAMAYYYAENYIETNYKINKNDLNSVEINYRRGMGLFDIEILDSATNDYYFFEVDIKDDYSLFYIMDLTEFHRLNKEN